MICAREFSKLLRTCEDDKLIEGAFGRLCVYYSTRLEALNWGLVFAHSAQNKKWMNIFFRRGAEPLYETFYHTSRARGYWVGDLKFYRI